LHLWIHQVFPQIVPQMSEKAAITTYSGAVLFKPRTLNELHSQVKQELERCKMGNVALARRRSKRRAVLRKTTNLQDFCETMSKLLESFPGINEAARAADQQIGGGLVACLSTLFQVNLSALSISAQLLTH
jgi:hypothetical protein